MKWRCRWTKSTRRERGKSPSATVTRQTLHLWWSRKPLAVARAVIFAQLVDDPSEYVDVLLSDPVKRRAAQRVLSGRRGAGEQEAAAAGDQYALREIAAEQERERLFGILKDLVRWENTTNETVLEQARDRDLA